MINFYSKQCDDHSQSEVLVVIPARGGSKGVPRKNMLDLGGKPLIAYSIEAALRANTVDRVIVSTEDEEIANVAKKYGAEVPFLRPMKFAGDRSVIGNAVNYTALRLQEKGYHPTVIVTLYPTQPFRTPDLLNHLIGKLLQGYSHVYTGKLIDLNQCQFWKPHDGLRAFPIVNLQADNISASYKQYIRLSGLFMGSAVTFNNEKPYLYLIQNPINLVDIDSWADYYFAKEIIKQRLFKFDSI